MNVDRRIKTITVKTISAVAVTTISAMALSSCTNEVAEDESADENGVALSIVSATIEETDTRVESLDAETFEENDTIGLYVFNEAGDAYNEANDNYNVPAEYDGTEWDVLGSIYISDESAMVTAYYPRNIDYGETIGTGSSGIPFDILDQDDILYTDVMSVDYSNPEVEFVFHHLLSRITFSVSVSDDIESKSINISKVGIKSTDSDMESEICISPSSTEGWLTYEESYTDEIYCFVNKSVTTENSAEVDVLVYPCSTLNKSAVLVIDGTSYDIDLPELTDEWEQGYQYIYYVTSVEGNFKVSSGTYIETWGSEEATGDVDIAYVESEPEAVDLGLTVKWASFNVGASSPEEFGNYFAWGETEPKDKYSQSTYFDSDYEIIEDIAGTEYDVATVKWGESWRMPTSEEIRELMENCTFERCTQDGVIGELVTSENGNTIFLPATGRYDGSVLSYEHNCYYWSSTPADGQYAYSLHIVRSDGVFEMCDERSRFKGLPVRPVLVE